MKHSTGTREDWLKARIELLKAEKELTKQIDAIAEQRQKLPWVRLEKKYEFQTEDGPATLKDLFKGRSQLIVYHFMFGPDYTAGCPSCSFIADGFNGFYAHLANHDVMLWAISRAPLEKLTAYKKRLGWTFPWASSHGGDFNTDFSVGFSERQQFEQGIDYNYRREEKLDRSAKNENSDVQGCGVDLPTYIRERPGMSTFALEDGIVYHCYSAYARGLDGLWGMYQWLDRAPLGRNEATGPWWRRHDEYAQR